MLFFKSDGELITDKNETKKLVYDIVQKIPKKRLRLENYFKTYLKYNKLHSFLHHQLICYGSNFSSILKIKKKINCMWRFWC